MTPSDPTLSFRNPVRTGSHTDGDCEARTYIARLIMRMRECLTALGIPETPEKMAQMERMSILIHESMSISSRNYHSVQHVFDISKDLIDPLAILAALFHDCVYYNIDGGLSTVQAVKLKGALRVEETAEGGPAKLTIADPTGDSLLSMVVQIYGYSVGQELGPLSGLNEYLSGVIAVRELENLLSREQLAEIAVCIEATIPFRPVNEENLTPMERVYQRLMQAVKDFDLKLSESDCVKAVQRAAVLTNEDVGNFGSEDQLWFLDNTWSLLPESNEALRHQFLYTVKEFQFAVFKMNGFFNFLQPTVVFNQFRSVPSNEELQRLTNNCRRNLEVGKKYVGAKLLSISVLAAFAELTGGDAPISLFMGDLPSRHHMSRRLEDTLPPPATKTTLMQNHCDEVVYDILAHGRRSETAFDVKQSPLAAYFYSFMGDEGIEQVLKSIKVYPMDQETAKALLKSLPRQAVLHVSENMSDLAMSRRELIRQVVQELPDNSNTE